MTGSSASDNGVFELQRFQKDSIWNGISVQYNGIAASASLVAALDFDAVTVDDLEVQIAARASDLRGVLHLRGHDSTESTFSPAALTSSNRWLLVSR
jgi:hypothetical protein